ncbi:hypothetical protein Tco_0393746 [Tanacetum coccineum]
MCVSSLRQLKGVLVVGAKDCQGGNWWDKVGKGVGRHRGEERGMMLVCYLAGSGDRATEKDVQLFPLYFEVWGISKCPESYISLAIISLFGASIGPLSYRRFSPV